MVRHTDVLPGTHQLHNSDQILLGFKGNYTFRFINIVFVVLKRHSPPYARETVIFTCPEYIMDGSAMQFFMPTVLKPDLPISSSWCARKEEQLFTFS